MQSISIFRQLGLLCVVSTGLLFSSCSKSNNYTAPSTTYNISASLTAAQEVPATNSTGTGTLTGTYDASTYKLSYTLNWSGLTGAATGMHFHGPAAAGTSAAVEVAITGFPSAASGTVSGTATLTTSQNDDLLGGKMYANIHTSANPAGEIRGQVSASK